MRVEGQIRKLFRYDIQADICAVHMTLCENGNHMTPELLERTKRIKTMQEGINIFYSLLSENEKLVIDRHYIAKLDWDCLCAEYAKMWGNTNTKSKRSLISYQNSAFKRMAKYVTENQDIFDFTWLERL